jgi:hypothetical protein
MRACRHTLEMARVFFAAIPLILVAMLMPAAAAELQFPASQFGQALLRYNQSLGGHDDYIRSQQNAVFEPLAEFNEADAFRIRSRPVGRLSMLVENDDGSEGVSTCTATLIDRDHVLTNYHCIPGFEGTVRKAVIHMGYLREDQEQVDSFEIDIEPVTANPDLDFAVLAVRGQPGDSYGFVEIDPVEVQPNASLIIYHHPAGSAAAVDTISLQSLCRRALPGRRVPAPLRYAWRKFRILDFQQ